MPAFEGCHVFTLQVIVCAYLYGAFNKKKNYSTENIFSSVKNNVARRGYLIIPVLIFSAKFTIRCLAIVIISVEVRTAKLYSE